MKTAGHDKKDVAFSVKNFNNHIYRDLSAQRIIQTCWYITNW